MRSHVDAHQEPTKEDLEKALRLLALLIERYGAKYWPIFERIDEELERIKARECRLAAALVRSLPQSKNRTAAD